jgi:hypothetical protein
MNADKSVMVGGFGEHRRPLLRPRDQVKKSCPIQVLLLSAFIGGCFLPLPERAKRENHSASEACRA